jgi:hypothetical protein
VIGLNFGGLDPDGIHFYYDDGVDDAILGSGVLVCLNKCWNMEESDFPLRPAEMARKNASLYPARLAGEKKRFGYKHNRARNQNMLRIFVKLNDKTITLEPTNHISLENWTPHNIEPIDHIKVDSTVSDAEFGRLIKLAFERCKNDFIAPITKDKTSAPVPVEESKNINQDVCEIALLCNGNVSAAGDIWQEILESPDDCPVFLASALSKEGYCFSSDWKRALLEFQDVFEKFMARFGIGNNIPDETKDAIYASTDIFDCLLLAHTEVLKHGYTLMYLNEFEDMCELVWMKSSDVDRVLAYLKRSRGIEMQSVIALCASAGRSV